MKKILIILLIVTLIRCSSTSKNTEINKEKIYMAIDNLMTEKEKQNLNNNNSLSLSVVSIDEPSYGVIGNGLKTLIRSFQEYDEETTRIVNLILSKPDTIFISENSDILLKAIKYVGNTVEGKKVLPRARFVFFNTPSTNASSLNKKEIENLSKLYNFKYFYSE